MIFQMFIAAAATAATLMIVQIPPIRRRLWSLAFRLRYRIESSPKKMEKTRMQELEDELQQILAEERKKDEIQSRRAHPAGRRRPPLDNSTKRMISDITRPGKPDNKSSNKIDGYYTVSPEYFKKWKFQKPDWPNEG